MTAPRQPPPERVSGLPTLPADERFSGPLDGVPRVYRHAKCGVETEMPEEIVRSYLADPWLYNDWIWCCGCEDNIRQQDLNWTTTGQRLSEYFAELRAQHPLPPTRYSLVREPIIFGVLGMAVGYFSGSMWLGLGVGVAFGLLLILARRLGIR